VKRQLQSGERLILVTDGVVERRTERGGRFGVEGLKRAISQADNPTAASTAMAVTQAVTDCWREPLEDDATVVVIAIA
jgi:serine phosphatase RsbU (regulator of sigma subunit)